jgi:hypothetical protein
MKHARIAGTVTWVLGIVSFVTFVLERLALQDIWHGEADVTAEWSMVFVSFPVILLFYVACFVTAILRAKAAGPGRTQV